MTNKKYEVTMEELDTITNIQELHNIIEKEKIQYTIFEGKIYRDKEQTEELLRKIATIANNFKQDFELHLSDIFGHYHILGISFTNDRPKVSTGYVWNQHSDISQEKEIVEHEFRVIKELNEQNEVITRKSFAPIGQLNYFETESNSEKYENATTILFDELQKQYLKEKDNKNTKKIRK